MAEVTKGLLEGYLTQLCEAPDRHVGGPGNTAAARLFAEAAEDLGWEVTVAELPCLDWERVESSLTAAGETFPLHTGPYSLPHLGAGRLAAASTVEELEALDARGAVLLLHGPIAAEQLMAKGFVFYNPEEHQRIVAAVEAAAPAAVLGATGQNPGLSGGAYPFPLFEDGDFDIPNAYLKDVDGERLLTHAGEDVRVHIDSRRIPATALQPVAVRRGTGERRITVFAHVDSKDGSPGALDNATGVTVLFGLLHELAAWDGRLTIELVPFNGEDYYGATGQLWWVRENQGRLGDIALGLNVDGAGYVGEAQDYSLYGCPDDIAAIVRTAGETHQLAEGPQWPQGDHSILAMQGVPAVAVISQNAFFVASTVAHTPNDTPDLADPGILVGVTRFFAEVIRGVDSLG
jgi:aminopeptidase YwaD